MRWGKGRGVMTQYFFSITLENFEKILGVLLSDARYGVETVAVWSNPSVMFYPKQRRNSAKE